MATHEIDQKFLGRLALANASVQPLMSRALFQILGLSIMLGPRLLSARKARAFLSTDNEDALLLLHQILWLSRTGLQLLEELVIPFVARDRRDTKLTVFTAKLRASFYHVFCLFRNEPQLSQIFSSQVQGKAQPPQTSRQDPSPAAATEPEASRPAPKSSPQQQRVAGSSDNGPVPTANPSSSSPTTNRASRPGLRDPIQSINSDTSYVTNIFPNDPMVRSPALGPPPGIPFRRPVSVVDNSRFLLPAQNYVPAATQAFNACSQLAVDLLPGSSPLRLSVILEHCAFLWDCLQDHKGSRALARTTIRDVYRASDPISDDDFEDSRILVATLGRMMRRKSADNTPRMGSAHTLTPQQSQSLSQSVEEAPPLPDMRGLQHGLSSSRPVTTFEEEAEGEEAQDTLPTKQAASAVSPGPPQPWPRPPRPVSRTVMDPRDNVVTARPPDISANSSITTTPESFKIARRPVASSNASPVANRSVSTNTSHTALPTTPTRSGVGTQGSVTPGNPAKRAGSPGSPTTPRARAKRRSS